MNEKVKMLNGEPYNVNLDDSLFRERNDCRNMCFEYNKISPANGSERRKKIAGILGQIGKTINVEPPFYCDYGWNIEVGDNFNSELNLVMQDAGGIRIGDNCYIGPNCAFYTKQRPFDAERRNEGVEFARPIVLGNNVCLGPHVQIMPGVTIGDNAVILGGSVVFDDIPEGAIAGGNPCELIQ